jgi:hypothetical protein
MIKDIGFWSTALLALAASVDAVATEPGRHPLGDAQRLAEWVRTTGDHQHRPFVILDKKAALLHVFDAQGAWRAASPVLLGLARGDTSVPGIGERKIADIRPWERTTPAGRFASEPGTNLQGEDIVWIDYDAAVSMHRVRANNPAERRAQRLASRTAADNRISYGCVNVPAAFYDAFIHPVLGRHPGVVYVLPETVPVSAFFHLPTRHTRLSSVRPQAEGAW